MNRKDYNNKIILFAYKLTHYLLSIILFFVAWILFRYYQLHNVAYNGIFDQMSNEVSKGFPIFKDVGFRYNFLIMGGFAVLLMFFNRIYNSYLFGYRRIRFLAFSQFLSQFFSTNIVYIMVSLGWNSFRNPLFFFILLSLYIIIDAIFAYAGNAIYFKLNPPRRTLLIYRNNKDLNRFNSISGKPIERLYNIVDRMNYDGDFHGIKSHLKDYEAVFVAGLNSHCRNGILKYCEEHDIRGFFLPHIGDVIMQGAQHIQAFDSPVMMARRKTIQPEYRVAKRLFDIVFSFVGLIIASPIMLATAIAIKVYDGGPILYKQVRLTKDGKHFVIIKFRSMKVNAEKEGEARLSNGNKDERITPIGSIIRKFRVDELPQLWNILTGDMSLVGPRPERPEIAEQYYKFVPDFALRLQVKAGLTGYAQVYGKYNTDPYEKLQFDLMYINNMGILTDLELIFATVEILFKSESTEGIANGQITAITIQSTANYEDNNRQLKSAK